MAANPLQFTLFVGVTSLIAYTLSEKYGQSEEDKIKMIETKFQRTGTAKQIEDTRKANVQNFLNNLNKPDDKKDKDFEKKLETALRGQYKEEKEEKEEK